MLQFCERTPGLLVSVRDPAEAMAAMEGGADVVDVKEPSRGSLGQAVPATIGEIVRQVSGRTMITAALGELREMRNVAESLRSDDVDLIVRGVSLVKLGLAGMASCRDWKNDWKRSLDRYRPARPVAVAYADWQTAGAPPPEDVLELAVASDCPALLIDTWQKSGGSLFDLWTYQEVARFVDTVRAKQIAIVLAGSLNGNAVVTAAQLEPDLIAVRTAACNGGRDGTVSAARVRNLKTSIAGAGSKSTSMRSA